MFEFGASHNELDCEMVCRPVNFLQARFLDSFRPADDTFRRAATSCSPRRIKYSAKCRTFELSSTYLN